MPRDELQPLMSDAETRRNRIRQKTIQGLEGLFPIVSRDYILEAKNVAVSPKDYSSNKQKEALLSGRTIHEPVQAELLLRDKKTGKVVDRKRRTLAHLPYFTQRHTFIVGGNEYDVPHQLRLKPGVYTRQRANGEYEAAFNLAKGMNFRLSMEPESGKFNMELGTSKIPLYSVLRALGVPNSEIKRHWGGELSASNAAGALNEEQALNKIIKKIKRRGDSVPPTIEGKRQYIRSYFFDNTLMDKDVNTRTLGMPVDRANDQALLAASSKLLRVQKGEDPEDDRDSLEFKTVHSVDDFFKERLDIDARRSIVRKLEWKLNRAKSNKIDDIVPNSTFTKSLNTFITNSSLAATPMQINPIEIIDHASRITALGEGGISSERAIPFESRKVHNTHLGILDPVRTPESFKAGIDVRAAIAAMRDNKGNLYSVMKDAQTGRRVHVPATRLATSVIAFPGQEGKKRVDAIKGTDVVSVDRKDVDYEVPDASFMFSPATSMVPLINGMQGNRAIMGSKFQTQALPLVEREAPYVQVKAPRSNQSMERELARLVVPTSPVDGTIEKIDGDFIYVRPDKVKTGAAGDQTIKLPYDTYFPLQSKTYLHNDLRVKKGDKVRRDQMLADSNFTKDDAMALGKNMSVAYMAYYGKNSNDAVVISEGAANKLLSEHMYKESLQKGPSVILGKDKYKAYYPTKYSAAQLAKLDSNGVAKKGETFEYGDPLIIALEKAAPTPEAALLGNFHKSLVKPYRDATVTWTHHSAGTVQDVMNAAKQIMVTVRTREKMKVGDKLSNRFGGKGVVSEIVPDERMVQDEAGKPVDVLFTSAGIVSRINPSQVVEAALGKVAEKTGKPVILPHFEDHNNVQYAKKLLKQHNLKDKETVYDPVSGKKVPDIFVGRSYIHKLFKSTDTNYAARGVSSYDVNLQPTRGGDEGAKGLGKMEINGLLAHNARNVLKEALTLKSERSDEFWRAYEFGQPLPPARVPFVADKFSAMLEGAGINLDKRGTTVHALPMTDRDVDKRSAGALTIPALDKSKSFMVRAKDLKPEKGGLFDPVLTGGLSGTKWSHMELSEPIVSPLFEEPVRRLLGLTKAQFRDMLRKEGGVGIRQRLKQLDLTSKKKELHDITKRRKGAELDNAVKQLKYIESLEKNGFKDASEAYVVSKVPVIPPVFRPILPSRKGGDLQIADSNKLYRDVGLASEVLREVSATGLPSKTGEAREHMYAALAALQGIAPPVSPQLRAQKAKGFIETITGAGSPKSGFFHKKLLKRQQDLSGRATAAPDASLDIDQIGIPEDMLWQLYSKFIMRGLVTAGHKPIEAKRMVEERHPQARSILENELKGRPVFVNRAPSLHKHNIIAAYPVPVPGKTLRVNPFIERGMNLDYDGDTLQIHTPVTSKAVDEAKQLTLSKVLFSDKNRTDLQVFPQHEAIIGVYAATANKDKGRARRFKTKADAMAAYRKGEISLKTPITIG